MRQRAMSGKENGPLKLTQQNKNFVALEGCENALLI